MIKRIVKKIVNAQRTILINFNMGRKVIGSKLNMSTSSRLYIERRGKIYLGDNFNAQENVKISVVGDGELTVGNMVFLNCNTVITAAGRISIGNDVQIGPNVIIFDHNHDYKAEGGLKSQKLDVGEIIIGNNVWIGAGAIILKNAVIGDNAVIAAGSIVNGFVESNSLFVQKRESTIVKY